MNGYLLLMPVQSVAETEDQPQASRREDAKESVWPGSIKYVERPKQEDSRGYSRIRVDVPKRTPVKWLFP